MECSRFSGRWKNHSRVFMQGEAIAFDWNVGRKHHIKVKTAESWGDSKE